MRLFLANIMVFVVFIANGQHRVDSIAIRLDSLSKTESGLNDKVEISVSGTNLTEFLRALGKSHDLNVSADPAIDVNLINSFSNASVKEIFIFLCKQYKLTIDFTGSIIYFKKYAPPPQPVVEKKQRVPQIHYEAANDFLSLDLKKDTLYNVAVELTKKSFRNVVVDPAIETDRVSVFIRNRPFEDALEKFAYANNLKLTKSKGNFFMLERAVAKTNARNNSAKSSALNSVSESLSIKDGKITLNVEDVSYSEVIRTVCREMHINYYLYSEPEGKTSLVVENADFEEFLMYLLNGTEYTYKVEEEVYLIGERQLERLRTTRLVTLENRTVENVLELIPSEMKEGLEIKEFLEMNGVILSGSHPQVLEVHNFLVEIDERVPLVTIELLIVDVSKTNSLTTGIEMGFGTTPDRSEGTVFPDLDVNLSTNAINNLIDNLNGFGVLNLGRVAPDFYVKIRALEENGVLKTKSTPKLATLNGHEASLSIGKTEFYPETTTNTFASQSVQTTNAIVWRSLNADFTIKIKPIVSGDDQVTLEIDVEQSDFTARISPNAPPGQISRSFSSMIRVANEEMILMGGLEEKSANDTGKGVPFLSRIPVIKHLFSSRSRQSSKTKLAIFIKPTVTK